MNSIERVFAAVTGKIPDRVPVSLTASLYGAALLNSPVKEYYRQAELYAEGQNLVASRCNTDVIFSPFALTLFAEACGARLSFSENASPNVKEYVSYRPGNKFHFDIGKLMSHPASEFILEATRLIAANLGKEKVIAAINISPCDLPAMVFGIEKWLHTLLFYPNEAVEIINNLGEYFLEMSSRLYQSGAHLMVLPLNFTNPQIVTRTISDYLIPIISELLLKTNGVKVIHHGGPDIEEAVVNYVSLNGVVGFVISPHDHIKAIRPLAGEKIILGNIDGPFLAKQSCDAIYKKCLRILEENEGNSRFILSTSNADISSETPLDNILAVGRAAVDFSSNKSYL